MIASGLLKKTVKSTPLESFSICVAVPRLVGISAATSNVEG